MARAVRRRRKQRVYWMEIGFLILGLIALRPSLVTDLASMGRANPDRYPPRSQLMSDYDLAGLRAGYPNAIGLSSYYPNWDQSPYQAIDPRLGQWTNYPQPSPSFNYPASNVAWPNAQVHQWVHNGAAAPHVASPTWNNTIPTGRY